MTFKKFWNGGKPVLGLPGLPVEVARSAYEAGAAEMRERIRSLSDEAYSKCRAEGGDYEGDRMMGGVGIYLVLIDALPLSPELDKEDGQ